MIDRNVCFGWGTGVVFMEVRAALEGRAEKSCLLDFMGDSEGPNITVDHIVKIIRKMAGIKGRGARKATSLGIDEV